MDLNCPMAFSGSAGKWETGCCSRPSCKMAYRRFYMDKKDLADGTLTITGDLFHDIRAVCRFSSGDRIEILTGDAKARLVEVNSISKRDLTATIISERALPAPAKPEITLALSVPKLPKVDWIIEKCV